MTFHLGEIIAAGKSNSWVLMRQRHIQDYIQKKLKCYIINDMSKMRKFKMDTILLYGKNKFSYIHPQMSSDVMNLPTVHPPPPQMPYMEKITEKIVINLMLTPFFTEGVLHI